MKTYQELQALFLVWQKASEAVESFAAPQPISTLPPVDSQELLIIAAERQEQAEAFLPTRKRLSADEAEARHQINRHMIPGVEYLFLDNEGTVCLVWTNSTQLLKCEYVPDICIN